MSMILKTLVFLLMTLFTLFTLSLNACSPRTDYAPISTINTIEALPKNGIYRVSQGETLYSIAWRYGLDYRDLAGHNHLNKPYHLHSGQIIYLTNAGLSQPIPPPVQNFAPHTHYDKKNTIPKNTITKNTITKQQYYYQKMDMVGI